MSTFLSSIITGFIGIMIASALGISEFWGYAFAFAGFSLPYAITIDKIYQMLKNMEVRDSDTDEIHKHHDISTIEVSKCPACLNNITASERKCPFCGLELLDE